MSVRKIALMTLTQLRDGLSYRFPICCVLWYCLIWEPVAAYIRKQHSDLNDHWLTAYVRGNDHPGYATCPRCRNRCIADYVRTMDVYYLRSKGWPLAETMNHKRIVGR